MQKAILRFDGSGKPGQAAAGIVITNNDGATITHAGVMLGDETSNVAEATGLHVGLQLAIDAGITHLTVQGDSELIFEQAFGRYSASGKLGTLAQGSRKLKNAFAGFSYKLIPRERNAASDAICHAIQAGWWTKPEGSNSDGSAHLGYVLSLRVERAYIEDLSRRNAIKRDLQKAVIYAFRIVNSAEVARTNAGPHDFGPDEPMLLTYLVHLHVPAITAADPERRTAIETKLAACATSLAGVTSVVVTRISG